MSSSASETTISAPAPATAWIFGARVASRCSTPGTTVRVAVIAPAISATAREIEREIELAIAVIVQGIAEAPIVPARPIARPMPATVVTPGRAAEAIVPLQRTGREEEVASMSRRAERQVLRPHEAGRALPVPAVGAAAASVAAEAVVATEVEAVVASEVVVAVDAEVAVA